MKSILFVCLALLTGNVALGLEVGDGAPCVVLDHVGGNGATSTHCIRDPNVEGQFKVLEFFSIFCSDCAKNRPNFLGLEKELGNKATFRFIATDSNEAMVRDFISKNPSMLETALDTHRDARTAYGVVATPTLFILNDKNDVVFKHVGVLTADDLEAIRCLLGN